MKSAILRNLLKDLLVTSLSVLVFLALFSNEAHAQSADICNFDVPDKPVYKASVVQVRQKRFSDPGSTFQAKVLIKNDGNVAWVSEKAGCADKNATWLGTARQKDRKSVFYDFTGSSGWQSPSRVYMHELRVDPGSIATFEFDMAAPGKNDFYKEYFAPLVDGVTWMDDALVEMDIQVGELQESLDTLAEKRDLLYYSNSAGNFDLSGKRSLVIDISKQRMWARIDGVVVREMVTSSGDYEHATPIGELKIAFKNRIRIGGKAPHYIMPYFMGLEWDNHRFNGYGLHHYPAYGNGTMRAEVRKRLAQGRDDFEDIYKDDWMYKNAVLDMGRRVSHGCVRTDGAPFIYEFMNVGDRVYIFNSVPEGYLDAPVDGSAQEEINEVPSEIPADNPEAI